MGDEAKKEIELEIAHVLFIDIVGYSKLLIDEQRDCLHTLNEVVRATEAFHAADAAGKLTTLPTGDGMALVFATTPDAPVVCALQIAKALKSHPALQLRMGIHSGPVSGVVDVSERANIAGAGINIAQRVMDCGDAGHILVSKRVADDLEQYRQWREHLHDLGDCEVKHGVSLHVVNLYTEELGNPEVPKKFRTAQQIEPQSHTSSSKRAKPLSVAIRISVAVLALIALAILAVIFAPAILRSREKAQAISPTVGEERSATAISGKSIAVLPFENLSSDKENAYFADGIQDEILTKLASIADLKVISRTSTAKYKSKPEDLKTVSQQLGVATVLEGSVQRAGNKVRVNAQLIDARSDAHLWAQTYDRDLADVFAIQSEIAKAIAEQLQAKLSPKEKNAIERPPTGDITAFDLYTRAKNLVLKSGRSSTAKTDLFEAIDLLNQAVARDPLFLQAYCQLALAHGTLYFFGLDHTPARLALSEANVQVAVRLRPDAGETHLARATNRYQGYLDYDRALAELELARSSLPNESEVFALAGYIQRRQGHWEQSTRNLEHAIELDPRNVLRLQQIASHNYHYFRLYAEEKSMWDRILAIVPDDVETKVARAGVELDSKADTRPLHQMIDSIRATNPAAMPSIAADWLICALAEHDAAAAKNALIALGENSISLGTDNVSFNRPFVEGVIARMTNDDGKARSAFTAARVEQEKIIQAQPNYGPALCMLGVIDAGLGRKEGALHEGRRAVELLPVEKDAIHGIAMVKYLAMIAAWVGDKDVACEQLASVIRRPSDLSYGQLKLLPFWDPLRSDPRFEKIVASLAPKD